jgi:hypothetical protein
MFTLNVRLSFLTCSKFQLANSTNKIMAVGVMAVIASTFSFVVGIVIAEAGSTSTITQRIECLLSTIRCFAVPSDAIIFLL